MATIWDQGIHGENQIIGIIDSLVNQDSCYLEDSINNTPGPNHRKIVVYNTSITGASSHGTHVEGIAVRENESGSLDNAGHAYKAKMTYANLNNIQETGNITVSNSNQMLEQAHTDGARIHTNSWGGRWHNQVHRLGEEYRCLYLEQRRRHGISSPTFSVPSFNLIGLFLCIALMGVLIFRSSCRPSWQIYKY